MKLLEVRTLPSFFGKQEIRIVAFVEDTPLVLEYLKKYDSEQEESK